MSKAGIAADFSSLAESLFLPGGIFTFTGAGGKSTAMRVLARLLSSRGLRVRMSTTTRIGMEEFSGYPVFVARSADQLEEVCRGAEPVRLIVSAALPDTGKYLGIDPAFFDGVAVAKDSVVLIEGDGSRRRPLKVPTYREPVIPTRSRSVFALMGASAFGEPIDEEHCYNHEAVFGILPPGACVFDAASLAVLAADPAGCRKGVASGMKFHVIINQGDLESKRSIGSELLRILEGQHINVSLVSLQQEVVYETCEL